MPGPILGTVDTMDEQAISQNRLEDAEITNSTTVDFSSCSQRQQLAAPQGSILHGVTAEPPRPLPLGALASWDSQAGKRTQRTYTGS